MKNTYCMNGYTLHLIPTDKFKTTTISLRLQRPLTKEETTLRSLLTFVLISATQSLPSTQLLSQRLEEHYGASLSAHIVSKGQSHIMNITTSFVNDLYLPQKENLLEKQLHLLNDLFFNPLIKDGGFDKDIVDIKKKELRERLQANKDDKFSYSLDKLFEYMGQDQPLGISSTGYEEDLDKITPKSLYQYFLKCIEEDEKHIYVVGDVDESIVQLFETSLVFPSHDKHYLSAYTFQSNHNDVIEFIEKQDVTQSKLNLGYTINCDFTNEKHYAMTVFNAIFGGFSQSRLFKVVRETHSLCYYVSSSYAAFSGVMIVNAGIDAKNYEKTKSLIQEQLQDIQNGHITDEEIEIAKILLYNSLKKTEDEASSMMSLAYNRDITNRKESHEEYIQNILNVSKEDIINVSQDIYLDTIFFLTGKEFYENH